MKLEFSGIVKKYTGNGTKFGFPTANIDIDDKSLDGLFLGYTRMLAGGDQQTVEVFDGRQLPSIIFIGTPRIEANEERRLESYILDFPPLDLYGSEIEVEIIKKLRDNQKFDSAEKLIEQMKKDEIAARSYFKESHNAEAE